MLSFHHHDFLAITTEQRAHFCQDCFSIKHHLNVGFVLYSEYQQNLFEFTFFSVIMRYDFPFRHGLFATLTTLYLLSIYSLSTLYLLSITLITTEMCSTFTALIFVPITTCYVNWKIYINTKTVKKKNIERITDMQYRMPLN